MGVFVGGVRMSEDLTFITNEEGILNSGNFDKYIEEHKHLLTKMQN